MTNTAKTDTALRDAMLKLAAKFRAEAAEEREHANKVQEYSIAWHRANARYFLLKENADEIEFVLAKYAGVGR